MMRYIITIVAKWYNHNWIQLERLSRGEVLSMLMFGAERIFRAGGSNDQLGVKEEDIGIFQRIRINF